MVRLFTVLILVSSGTVALSQSNILSTNITAEEILLGNYNPADYAASTLIDDPMVIAQDIRERINRDSLKSYLIKLAEFETRNTGSDTVSATTGVGAARRWVHAKFEEFSTQNENRLVSSYLQFDQDICGMGQHRNIYTVLPGSDPDNNGVVIIEGHMDSRCEGVCDTECKAEGVEDNGSGTVLVMELARVMSQYTFKNTIVFLVTIGEEQGLLGANAFAEYVLTKDIPLRAVLNNDVIGGVICGESSSPPSCPGLNHVDSVGVRIFSFGSQYSRNKQLARYTKLEYEENLKSTAAVPMDIRILSPEDRAGRGGDHIPFRQRGYPAIRYCAANEHGDASNGPGYSDRQHTTEDILGVDTDNDQVIDSFFVQFHYLSRNALINANAAAMIARNVPTPQDFSVVFDGTNVTVTIDDPAGMDRYRVATRSTGNDWDTVYTLDGTNTISFPYTPFPGISLFVSVAGVDAQGIESLFLTEQKPTTLTGVNEPVEKRKAYILYQNKPNPFDEATWINFDVLVLPDNRNAMIRIADMSNKLIEEIPVKLKEGNNEVLYRHGYGASGAYVYSLVVEGNVVASRRMIFAF